MGGIVLLVDALFHHIADSFLPDATCAQASTKVLVMANFSYCHTKGCKHRPQNGNRYCCECRPYHGPTKIKQALLRHARLLSAQSYSRRMARRGKHTLAAPLPPPPPPDADWLLWKHFEDIAQELHGPNANIPSFLGAYLNSYHKVAKGAFKQP